MQAHSQFMDKTASRMSRLKSKLSMFDNQSASRFGSRFMSRMSFRYGGGTSGYPIGKSSDPMAWKAERLKDSIMSRSTRRLVRYNPAVYASAVAGNIIFGAGGCCDVCGCMLPLPAKRAYSRWVRVPHFHLSSSSDQFHSGTPPRRVQVVEANLCALCFLSSRLRS